MGGVVIGLGNDIMRDDAVGIIAANALASNPALPSDVEVVKTGEMGLSLLDFLVDRDWVIFIDTVKTGKKPLGHIHRLEVDNATCFKSKNPHNMGIGEVFYIGRKLGLSLPKKAVILAMEVKDKDRFGDEMTPEVKAGLTRFLETILEEVRRCTSTVSPKA
jgi:hydrogenase maturation protease